MKVSPAPELLRRIVEIATRAPSIHNTQPWQWRLAEGGLELHADRDRQLHVADPQGRNLVISCGAALHHLQVAAAALGWSTEISRVPDGPDSPALARIVLHPAPSPATADSDLRAIDDRCTDRRRFTSWPVPDERLQQLANGAARHGVLAVPLLDVSERFRAELLVGRAIERQAADQRFALEQQQWIDCSAVDGIPSAVLPDRVTAEDGARPSRFPSGQLEDTDRTIEGSDGLIVLCSGSDDVATWLKAGEALSALWLAATVQELAVVPLSQVVEVAETRDSFQRDVLGGLAHPLILVRVGWQAISRSQLPRTSRRPVDDVLDLS